MEQYKVCKSCSANLPLSAFHKAKDNRDGRRNTCRNCQAVKDKARYNSNADAARAKALAYYHANKEDRARYSARRYQENKTEIAELRKQKRRENIWHYKKLERASYQRNKEQKRAKSAESARLNPNKSRARNSRRRALLNGASTKQITQKEIARLYASNCLFCNSSGPIDLDHAIPLSRGGSHSIGNLIPLCDNCNSTKYNKTIMEWRIYRLRIGSPLPNDKERNV